MGSNFDRVAAYWARPSTHSQDWTSQSDVPGAFDRAGVETTTSRSPVYCLTSTVISRSMWSGVKEIGTHNENLVSAGEGEACTFVIADEVKASCGNMLVAPASRPLLTDQFALHVIWSDANPTLLWRSCILRAKTDSASATVTALKQQMDVNTFMREAAKLLQMNKVGFCNISTRVPIAFDSYKDKLATGNLVFVDRVTSATVGAPLIDFPLRRRQRPLAGDGREQRCARNDAEPAPCCPVVHRTFRPRQGDRKCTRSAPARRRQIHASGRQRQLRPRLQSGVGFTDADRVEETRRVAEVCQAHGRAGPINLQFFMSPFRGKRRIRELLQKGEFIEILVDTPLEECARSDPKGLEEKRLPVDPELYRCLVLRNPRQSGTTPESNRRRSID